MTKVLLEVLDLINQVHDGASTAASSDDGAAAGTTSVTVVAALVKCCAKKLLSTRKHTTPQDAPAPDDGMERSCLLNDQGRLVGLLVGLVSISQVDWHSSCMGRLAASDVLINLAAQCIEDAGQELHEKVTRDALTNLVDERHSEICKGWEQIHGPLGEQQVDSMRTSEAPSEAQNGCLPPQKNLKSDGCITASASTEHYGISSTQLSNFPTVDTVGAVCDPRTHSQGSYVAELPTASQSDDGASTVLGSYEAGHNIVLGVAEQAVLAEDIAFCYDKVRAHIEIVLQRLASAGPQALTTVGSPTGSYAHAAMTVLAVLQVGVGTWLRGFHAAWQLQLQGGRLRGDAHAPDAVAMGLQLLQLMGCVQINLQLTSSAAVSVLQSSQNDLRRALAHLDWPHMPAPIVELLHGLGIAASMLEPDVNDFAMPSILATCEPSLPRSIDDDIARGAASPIPMGTLFSDAVVEGCELLRLDGSPESWLRSEEAAEQLCLNTLGLDTPERDDPMRGDNASLAASGSAEVAGSSVVYWEEDLELLIDCVSPTDVTWVAPPTISSFSSMSSLDVASLPWLLAETKKREPACQPPSAASAALDVAGGATSISSETVSTEVLGLGAEADLDLEVQDVVAANVELKVRLDADTVQQVDMVKLYKGSRALQRGPHREPTVLSHLLASAHPPLLLHKYTYQLLAESRVLQRYGALIVREFRGQFEALYRCTERSHTVEWLLLLDNSGSMLTKRKPVAEAVALMTQSLQRLECPFAVGRFGDRNRQVVVKELGEPFDFLLGQRILDCLTYDEATYPATGLQNIAPRVWSEPVAALLGGAATIRDEDTSRHRVVLMILDGLTQERVPEDYLQTLRRHGASACVLNVKDARMQGLVDDVSRLWHVVTDGLYEILDAEEADHLPTALATLMTKQLARIIRDSSSKDPSPACEVGQTSRVTPDEPLLECRSCLTCTTVTPLPSAMQLPQLPDLVRKCRFSDLISDGAPRPSILVDVSLPGQPIPFLVAENDPWSSQDVEAMMDRARVGAEEAHTRLIGGTGTSAAVTIRAGTQGRTGVSSSGSLARGIALAEVTAAAEALWSRAEAKLVEDVDQMQQALEEAVLPYNRFTRKSAAAAGSSLHLPGLIRAISTNFAYKKIFAQKSTGGRRDYAVCLLLDVSPSMRGVLAKCTCELLVTLAAALHGAGVAFAVMTFADHVQVVKTLEMPFDAATKHLMLSALSPLVAGAGPQQQAQSMDGDAVRCAVEAVRGVRGPKKVFVLTDGYGTMGTLKHALRWAEQLQVEIVGMAVGLDASFVPSCYQHWVAAADPSFMPQALRLRCDSRSTSDPAAVIPGGHMKQWQHLAAIVGNDLSVEEILEQRQQAFPNLGAQLRQERELKLVSGQQGVDCLSCDIMFVLDVTGSMGPWISAAKEQIGDITRGMQPVIEKEYPDVIIEFRFGCTAFRDISDDERFMDCAFTEDTDGFTQWIQNLRAQGGEDIPEDVLGAMSRAATGPKWQSRIKYMVLITDAPSHGLADANVRDSYPGGDPGGLTAEKVAGQLHDAGIELCICTINEPRTRRMLRTLRQAYDIDDHRMEVTNLFDASASSTAQFHFVFVLDGSGSMSGQKWASLRDSYNRFIAQRQNDQGDGDLVSAVEFGSGAMRRFVCSKLMSAPQLPVTNHSGGTLYSVGMQEAQAILSESAAAFAHYTPVLVFMSDGIDGGNTNDAISTMQHIYDAHRTQGIQIHTIGFGNDELKENMRKMALLDTHANVGHYHQAADKIQLQQTFQVIASGCNAVNGLVQKFGEYLSKMLAHKIVTEHL
ncbi:hypothetical protein CYMTET_31322 [Cymbomonas tetramitiformis]|uniref:VWFA domain-containing protein n=1 Tax=Cymbomonas tetramitiformis TaxID=36881 RepID=A0AAE0FHP2_9CHLO|nr:hypothetical protein CYMTET_31322 [Cymbomonas tetramitiformis]